LSPATAASPEGFLLPLALALPAIGVALAVVLGGRHAERVALVSFPLGLGLAAAIASAVWRTGDALVYFVGAWAPPLGLTLRADGLSAAMLVTSAVLIGAAGLYGRADFTGSPRGEARAPLAFWTLLLTVWTGLNAAFLGSDLFNLFVALELLTFGAVPLVSLGGSAETLRAALRYLLFALIGSVLFLLGVGLLYGAYGTLDIALLAGRVRVEPAARVAVVLMTVGLLAKGALFPLHLWLPPAHAGAPPAASAVLSALVVKAPFFLIARLWIDALPGLATPAAEQILGVLGACAIVYGGVLAVRQTRLKMLVAYSTVAQIGYLFLVFPLSAAGTPALAGGIVQAIAHALAKSSMFLSVGLIARGLGHDRIDGLAGAARALPLCLLSFGLAGVSLIGLQPSLLRQTALDTDQWWWMAFMLAGGALTAAYVVRVLASALGAAGAAPPALAAPVQRSRALLALVLALLAFAVRVLPLGSLLRIGRES
jgi:formate hydrogenlyase subunit 3/multisubunit Na+/H+ antiporter MnhD subunit